MPFTVEQFFDVFARHNQAMRLVNTIAFHWTFFATVNPAARLFAAAFVVQALLMPGAAAMAGDLRLQMRRDPSSILGLALIGFALVIYPAIGWLAGRRHPAMPLFGLAPCPTTISTIGLLLQGPWPTLRWLLVFPGLWAAVGGSASILLKVPQDDALVASLLVLLAIAVGHWRDRAIRFR